MRNTEPSLMLILALGIVLISGCSGLEKEPRPENLVKESVYINLLIELQHIRTYANAQPDSVNVDSLKQVVYGKYQVNEEDFLASHRYYQSDVKGQLRRTEQAITQLEEDEATIQAYIDSVKAIHNSEQDSLAKADSLAAADSLTLPDSLDNLDH